MYYALNLQGDVVRILNANGSTMVKYAYNAWGEVISITNANDVAITSATHIGNLNPLRYRGYYYDTETGFYYLQSRYYDPTMHRFINADSLASTGQGILGYNMFAYCLNNSTNLADYTGKDAIVVSYGGHLGILVEGEDGNWYHFYWGASDGSSSSASSNSVNVSSLWGTKSKTWCELYVGPLDLESINNSQQYKGTYAQMTYLYGDFASCLEEMNNISGEYNLLSNNCAQVSLRILASADTPYSDILTEASTFMLPALAHASLDMGIAELKYAIYLKLHAPHAGSRTAYGVKE